MESRENILQPLTPKDTYTVKFTFKQRDEQLFFNVRNCKAGVSREDIRNVLNELANLNVFKGFQYATPVTAIYKKSSTQILNQLDY